MFSKNLGDPSYWQSIYEKYGVVDLYPNEHVYGYYKYKGYPISQSDIDKLSSISQSYMVSNWGNHPLVTSTDGNDWAKYPDKMDEMVKFQLNYLDENVYPWNTLQEQKAIAPKTSLPIPDETKGVERGLKEEKIDYKEYILPASVLALLGFYLYKKSNKGV